MATVAERIRGLSPLGPIFEKELRITARRKRTYWLRFLYLGALLLLLLFFYSVAYATRYDGGGVAQRAQRLAEMGGIFFALFSYFTLTAMCLIGAILTSTAINSEKLHKTLAVLVMTPITAWQIVWGKLFSRLLVALTLIGLSLPVLAVVRLVGGVELEQMAASLCICVSVAIFAAALGLFLSTMVNRSYSVILLAYGVMMIIYLLFLMMTALIMFELMRVRGVRAEQWFFNVHSVINPFIAMAFIAVPDRPISAPIGWYWCVLAHLGMAALLVSASAAMLRRVARRENEGGAGTTGVQLIARKEAQLAAGMPQRVAPPTLLGQLDAQSPLSSSEEATPRHTASANRAGSSQSVSNNPVLWRELRRPLVGKVWQRTVVTIFFVGTMLLMYLILAVNNDLDDRGPQIGFGIVMCGLMNLLVCVLSGTAIAQEKESDTWTLLLATPMTPWQIVWGKMAGLLRRLMWPSLLIIAHFLLFTVAGVVHPAATLVVFWMIFTSNMVWIATGLYLSLRMKTVTFAVIFNLLGPVIVYGVTAAVLGILGAVLDNSDNWAEVVGWYLPYLYIGNAIDSFSRSTWQDIWMPNRSHLNPGEFLTLAFFVGLGYLAVTAAILYWTTSRFNRIVGRAEQQEIPERRRGFSPILPAGA